MGTAGAADGEPLAAAALNPAAAGLARGPSVALGYLFAAPDLSLRGRDGELEPAHGILVAAAVPFRLWGVDLGAALSLHVPDRFLARVTLLEATEPRLVRWDNWVHRTSATAVLSAGLGAGVSVGAGAAVLADASATGRIDLGSAAGLPWADAEIDLELPLRVAPVAGLRFEPAPFLALALTFRGALAMKVDLGLSAEATLADDAVTGDARTRLRGTSYFSPRTLVFAACGRWAGLTLDVDVAWRAWSELESPFADVDAAVALGAPAAIVNRLFPHPAWLDTWVPSVGLEYLLHLGARHRLAFRAGYSFEQSPVPPQTGLTNLADPDRHLASAGVGWTMDLGDAAPPDGVAGTPADDARDPHGSSLEAGAAFQAHRLVPFTTDKDVPEFTGGPLSAGGWVWAGQAWVGVTL
jgi:hypothetical protein